MKYVRIKTVHFSTELFESLGILNYVHLITVVANNNFTFKTLVDKLYRYELMLPVGDATLLRMMYPNK